MTESPARTFSGDFRRFFLRGLVVLLPSVLTLWIVVKAYQFIDKSIAEPVNASVRLAMAQAIRVLPPLEEMETFSLTREEIITERLNRGLNALDTSRDARIVADLRARKIEVWWNDHWYMDFIGLVVAIVAVYIAGRLLGGFVGRRIYRKVEDILTSVPIFKQVYPYVKQIVDFLFSDERAIKFNRVVVVQYPRKGIWSVGFLTGETLRSVAERAGDSVTIFIPSSPTPFTGYTITVPRKEAIELPISVEEAIRFAVSGGVLVPDHQLMTKALDAKAAPPAKVGAPPAGADRPALPPEATPETKPRRKAKAKVRPTRPGADPARGEPARDAG